MHISQAITTIMNNEMLNQVTRKMFSILLFIDLFKITVISKCVHVWVCMFAVLLFNVQDHCLCMKNAFYDFSWVASMLKTLRANKVLLKSEGLCSGFCYKNFVL